MNNTVRAGDRNEKEGEEESRKWSDSVSQTSAIQLHY